MLEEHAHGPEEVEFSRKNMGDVVYDFWFFEGLNDLMKRSTGALDRKFMYTRNSTRGSHAVYSLPYLDGINFGKRREVRPCRGFHDISNIQRTLSLAFFNFDRARKTRTCVYGRLDF